MTSEIPALVQLQPLAAVPLEVQARARIVNDVQACSLWLGKYADTYNTVAAYKKEAERFLLWLETQNLTIPQVSLAAVLAYSDFIRNPLPREKWCSDVEPQKLPDGSLNPRYKHTRRKSRYLPDGTHNPEWRPFVSGLSAASSKHALEVLFGLFEFLCSIQYISANPFRAARRNSPKPKKTIERFLEKDTLNDAIAALEQLPTQTPLEIRNKERIIFIFKFMLLTGLRLRELANMRWEDIYKLRGNYWLRVHGKGNRQGDIPIADSTLTIINRYRQSIALPDFDETATGPVVLSIRRATPLTGKGIHQALTAVLRKLPDPRLAKVSAHWLRHTAATLMIDSGLPLTIVRDNMRHGNISTTCGYLHTDRDARHAATSNIKL